MIRLIKSTFYREKMTQMALSKFVLQAKQLSFGPQGQAFEQAFGAWQGRNYCAVVNSGSSANLAVIQALLNLGKLKRGDKVGFSAVTWSTNVMPLIQLGLVPVVIDVELDTLNMSSRTLSATIKEEKIACLMLTNLLGLCDDIDNIAVICKEKNILLIEDNCESLGTVYKGKKLGNFGLASTFSFYVGHHMSTIEGGAICTNNAALYDMLCLVRAHGWDRNLSFSGQEKIRKKFNVNSTFYSRYTFYDLGYNLRPTEITGFLGQEQLKYIDEIVRKRQENFLNIAKIVYANTDKYYPVRYAHLDVVSNFSVPLICKTAAIRDEIVKMCDGVVEIRPIVGGDMSKQPFMKKYVSRKQSNLPNATIIHEQGLYFGNNPELTKSEIKTLIQLFS